MQFTSLQAWLSWLEQCHPQEIELGLDRIRQVASRLDLLTPKARVVTVAGTNGKGSCVTATAALLQAAGLRVGVYTSPHLLAYNERIVIDGKSASDDVICTAFARIAQACEGISLTYFEYGTLAALAIFTQQNVDIMVLEVGLGGRLDAVNILSADIAVITSIDIDHQDWLGDNREVIGTEKAGIMRAQRPVICADPEPPASLMAAANALGAPWFGVAESFGFSRTIDGWHWWGKNLAGQLSEYTFDSPPSLPLPSMSAALQVVHLLGIDLTQCDIARVLDTLLIPGRFQRMTYAGCEVILDVAHNPAACAYLCRRLQAQPVAGRTFALVAMMSDKNRIDSLRNLQPVIDAWYLAELDNIPRAATSAQLRQDLAAINTQVDGVGSIAHCLQQLTGQVMPHDRIVICGSFYTVAAALTYMGASKV